MIVTVFIYHWDRPVLTTKLFFFYVDVWAESSGSRTNKRRFENKGTPSMSSTNEFISNQVKLFLKYNHFILLLCSLLFLWMLLHFFLLTCQPSFSFFCILFLLVLHSSFFPQRTYFVLVTETFSSSLQMALIFGVTSSSYISNW